MSVDFNFDRIHLDKPQAKPGAVHMIAPLDGHTGYGLHGTYLALSLLEFGCELRIKPTRQRNVDARLIEYLNTEEMDRSVHTLLLETTGFQASNPDYWFTMYETTRLPGAALRRVSQANHLLVPSNWNATCFSAQGITRPIHVCPLGYNPEVFKPAPAVKECVFGMLGTPSLSNTIRKNFDLGVRAFLAAFGGVSDVKLKVKQLPTCPAIADLDPRIQVDAAVWTEQQVAEWYQSLTALILPSRCEAWGFPALQAMACARPVIAARYGGLTDYLDETNSYGIDYRLVTPKRAYNETGLWAEPDLDSLVDILRYVYDNQEQAAARGQAARLSTEAYTWKAANQKVLDVLITTGFFEPIEIKPTVVVLKPEVAEDAKPPLFEIKNPNSWNPAPLPVKPGPGLKPVQYCSTCFVHLGRYGDLLNVLPVVKHVFDNTGIKPTMLVSHEFADVTEWATYFNVEDWGGPYLRVKPGIAWAKERFQNVLVTQPCGEDHMLEILCDSFAQEAWRAAGCLNLWGNLPLVLDHRNQYREQRLISEHISDKPVILLALDSHSSPYPRAEDIRQEIVARNPLCTVVDISRIRAHTLIDLLGLMDRAACLITIDSAPLHLAVASQVPVIAFITDQPSLWNGTKTRCNVVYSQRYGKPIDFDSIQSIINRLTQRKFFHVYSDFEGANESPRYQQAAKTWPVNWATPVRVTDDQVRLLAKKPFFKDIIKAGITSAYSDDVIIYTNRDICFASDAPCLIRNAMLERDCVYSFRRDYMGQVYRVSSTDILENGIPFDGCDLFAFTVQWWLEHQSDFPDFVIGAPEWDRTLRRFMEASSNGSPGLDGVIYHQWHDPPTLISAGSVPEQHNLELAKNVSLRPVKSRFGSDVDALRRFYRKAQKAIKIEKLDFNEYALSNNPSGIGDVVLLSSLPKASTEQGGYIHIFHKAEHFRELMRFNPWYKPYDGRMTVSADLLQTTFDIGNGHFIQRLQRAFNLKPDRVPRGVLVTGKDRVPNRCAIHFDAGAHAAWQRGNLHHRAREVYRYNISRVGDLIKRHRHDMTFYEVGRKFSGLDLVTDCTSYTLPKTVELLASCEWFIGIISGPMHLATALGVKCIVIVNFPHANQIYLPTLVDINQVESEWFYPQNVHLHQDGDGELVKQFSIRNIELALEGAVYPYWTDDYLDLISEPL